MEIYNSDFYIINEFEDKIYKLITINHVDSMTHALRYGFEEVAFTAYVDGKMRWFYEDVDFAKDYIELLVYPLELTLEEELKQECMHKVKLEDYFIHIKPDDFPIEYED